MISLNLASSYTLQLSQQWDSRGIAGIRNSRQFCDWPIADDRGFAGKTGPLQFSK